jgi:hypothetical protein
LPDGLKLALTLGDGEPAILALSRYPTGRWRPGEVVHEKYSLAAPPEAPAGHYPVRAQLLTPGGASLPGATVTLGEVEVLAVDRLFELPADMPRPLDYRFQDMISLRGLDLATEVVMPGEDVRLALYWQTARQPAELYTAFVHLMDREGNIVAQDDHWPGGLPSNSWAAGQVILDKYTIRLPADAPPGSYQIAVGLYTADNGLRLPVTDAAGTLYPDNRLFLPTPLTVTAADE